VLESRRCALHLPADIFLALIEKMPIRQSLRPVITYQNRRTAASN